MSAYNNAKYIQQALDSVLMQECDFKFEIIVGEDCSEDETRSILLEYKKKYPDIFTLILHRKNQGATKNMAAIFEKAKGKYIAMLDSDDYWRDSKKLQKQVDFLEDHPEYVLSHHDVDLVDENNIPVNNAVSFTPQDYSQEQMLCCEAPTRMASMVFRNENLIFTEKLLETYYNLLMLVHVLGFNGMAKYQSSVGNSAYRVHSGGIHSGLKKWDQTLKAFKTKLVLKNNIEDEQIKLRMQSAIELRLLETLFVSLRERDMETYKKLIAYIREEHEIDTISFLAKHSVDVVKRISAKFVKKIAGR